MFHIEYLVVASFVRKYLNVNKLFCVCLEVSAVTPPFSTRYSKTKTKRGSLGYSFLTRCVIFVDALCK